MPPERGANTNWAKRRKECPTIDTDLERLKERIRDENTEYIVVYPDSGIDLYSFVQDLRRLLNQYHTEGQAWMLGSNITVDGRSLIDVSLDAEDELLH